MDTRKRIILLDLDGTLIDQQYQLTLPDGEVRAIMDHIQGNHTLIGLNSDTPLIPVRIWAERLGLQGPLIAEKGQLFQKSSDDPPLLLGEMRDFFHDLRRQVIFSAHEEIKEAFVGIGDVTEFLRQGGSVHGADRCAVLINGYRQCSFSAYALVRRGERLVKDADTFARFCDLVFSIIGDDLDKLDEADKNQNYGILILHEKGASKTSAVERLVSRMGTEAEYVMIGDGDSDIIHTKYPIRLCAVGNASPRLKEKARETGGIVAGETFTRGVLEILMSLD